MTSLGENNDNDSSNLWHLPTTEDGATYKTIRAALHGIQTFIPPIIFITGMVGNTLSFIIMNRPQFRHTTSSVYMRYLAVSDALYLVGRVLQRYILTQFSDALRLHHVHTPFCIQYLFFSHYAAMTSAYLVVFMTVERAIVLMLPLKTMGIFTPRKAHISNIVMMFSWGLIYIAVTVLRREHPNYSVWLCPFHLHGGYDLVYEILKSTFRTYVPGSLLLLSNVAIVMALRNRIRTTCQKSTPQLEFESGISVTSTRDSVVSPNPASMGELKPKSKGSQESQITVMLLAISVTYLALTLPHELKYLYWKMFAAHTSLMKEVRRLSNGSTITIESINYAINFFLYTFSCRKFRRELYNLFSRPTV